MLVRSAKLHRIQLPQAPSVNVNEKNFISGWGPYSYWQQLLTHPQPGGWLSMNERPFFVVGTIISHAWPWLILWSCKQFAWTNFEKSPFSCLIGQPKRPSLGSKTAFGALPSLGPTSWLVFNEKWIKHIWMHGRWPIEQQFDTKWPSIGAHDGPKGPSFGHK